MDQRGIISLELEKNGKKFSFTMPMGTPLGEAYDAAFSFLSEVLEMSKRAVEKAEKLKVEDKKAEKAIATE